MFPEQRCKFANGSLGAAGTLVHGTRAQRKDACLLSMHHSPVLSLPQPHTLSLRPYETCIRKSERDETGNSLEAE
jgi:hypothetical protein